MVPYQLASSEKVARFLHTRRHFIKGRVNPSAFHPPPDLELSVTHTTDLQDDQIWEVALSTLSNAPGRETVYARADVPVETLESLNLIAVRDDDPFERHTCVKGWPKEEDPNQQKQKLKLICLEISQSPHVTLMLPAEPITKISTT